MKKMIEKYEDRDRMWSDKDIDRTKKVEKISTPANYRKAIDHFEAGYNYRRKRQSWLKKAGYVTLLAFTAGLSSGVATEMSSAQNTSNEKSPTAWIGNSINTAIENAEDLIRPSNFESIGQQSVIAQEGDTIIDMIQDNVKGWAKLNSEQFMILVKQTMERNGIDGNRQLQIGESIDLPESVTD